jgi:hypothetical protein
MVTGETGPEHLTIEQALGYWVEVARTLGTILGQLDTTTPSIDQFDGMVDDLREMITTCVVGANALVGHYTVRSNCQPAPVSGGISQQVNQPEPAPVGYVPVGRVAVLPSYDQHPQSAGSR